MRLRTFLGAAVTSMALGHLAVGQINDTVRTEPVQQEMKNLEGTWTLEGFEQDGEKTPAKEFSQPIEVFRFNASTVIKDGKLSMTLGGEIIRYSIAVDLTKTPKTLDRVVLEGKSKGTTDRYLYELDGDTLRLCFDAEMTDVRPDTFTSDDTLTILTFKRKKP